MAPTQDRALEQAAASFEAMFIAQMLSHAGMEQPRESFGGGPGEEQFSGFLREAQAMQLAQSGGIGLAQYILAAVTEKS
jgi:Rod binding domain-containing protein